MAAVVRDARLEEVVPLLNQTARSAIKRQDSGAASAKQTHLVFWNAASYSSHMATSV